MTANRQSSMALGGELAAAVERHLLELGPALESLGRHTEIIASWAAALASTLWNGGRLLVAGNGGSAAEAQHLSAEIVGRYLGERPPFSALALHTDSSCVTAIGNDYGFERIFARQVAAHGRSGDILLLLSTSGRSGNLLHAAKEATARGLTVWAMTGALPNPLAGLAEECIALSGHGASVQEAQLIAIHALCICFDLEIARMAREGDRT